MIDWISSFRRYMKRWGYKDKVPRIPTAGRFVAGTYEIITQSMREEKARRHASVMRRVVLEHALVNPDSQRLCSLLSEPMFASAPFSHQVTWPKAARGMGLRECESLELPLLKCRERFWKEGVPRPPSFRLTWASFTNWESGNPGLQNLYWPWGFSTQGRAFASSIPIIKAIY